MFKSFFAAALLALGLVGAGPVLASNQLATAISGYDAVSYRSEGGPVEGRARFHHFWNGAVWFFSSEENLKRFVAEPAAFAPEYDGYCAWAASQDYKRPGDPNVWQIEDGKLYLMVHEGARDNWRKDVPTHIAQGGENWVRIAPY